MLPFGVTIPATVPQRSEIPEELMNYPVYIYIYIYIYIYTECPRRNVPDFGRVFLMLKYTDITQNTYVQT